MQRRLRAMVALTVLTAAAASHAGTLTPIPDPYSFGNVPVGGAPAVGTVVLTNSGGSTTVTGFTPSGTCSEFTASASNPGNGQPVSASNPAVLGNGQTLTVNASYSPGNRGSDTCLQTVACNCSAQASFTLQGIGIAPVLGVAPGSLDFGNQHVSGSASLSLTLSNDGDANLSLNNYTLVQGAASYIVTPGTCGLPGSLTPQDVCAIGVTFKPTTMGAKPGTLRIQSNDPLRPNKDIALTGVGTQAIQTFNPPSSLDFGKVPIGTTKVATLTVGNTGTETLNLAGAPAMSISGGNAVDFDFADHGCSGQGCDPVPNTVAPGASTAFGLGCTPSNAGARLAQLTVMSDDPQAPRSITLACTGDDTIFANGFE